jgi:hypothetical protein
MAIEIVDLPMKKYAQKTQTILVAALEHLDYFSI